MERGQSGPGQRGAAGLHIGRLYNSVAVTWKKGGREPLGFTSRQASILALIIWPTSTSKISPFSGAWSLRSEKRSRDPSRQVIVISRMIRAERQHRHGQLTAGCQCLVVTLRAASVTSKCPGRNHRVRACRSCHRGIVAVLSPARALYPETASAPAWRRDSPEPLPSSFADWS
jgi:hypothetical protein